jgi:glutamyl-tRNA synthetase
MAEKEELKLKQLLPLFFVAITGSRVSLPLYDSMGLLGRDMCLRRMQYALEVLDAAGCGLSGKKLKKLQKAYTARYA